MKRTGTILIAVLAVTLLAGAAFQLHSAVLSGGSLKVSALSLTSGAGTPSSGGTLTVSAGAIGQNLAGAAMTGGTLSVTGGLVPVIVGAAAPKTDLSAAHCYPVPFKPSEGHTKITFQDLTGKAEIRIYTIAGELVRSLSKSDANDYFDWDVRNSKGEQLASGVFVYVIKAGGKTKKGKLMVIR
jgi:hypothetical protein